MIETENQSDSRASRQDQQNEAGGDNQVDGNKVDDNGGNLEIGDETAAATTATIVENVGERERERYPN